MKRRTFTKIFSSALVFLGLKSSQAINFPEASISSFESMTDIEFVNSITRGYIAPKYGLGGVLFDNVRNAKQRQKYSAKFHEYEVERMTTKLSEKLDVWKNRDFEKLFMLDVEGAIT